MGACGGFAGRVMCTNGMAGCSISQSQISHNTQIGAITTLAYYASMDGRSLASMILEKSSSRWATTQSIEQKGMVHAYKPVRASMSAGQFGMVRNWNVKVCLFVDEG